MWAQSNCSAPLYTRYLPGERVMILIESSMVSGWLNRCLHEGEAGVIPRPYALAEERAIEFGLALEYLHLGAVQAVGAAVFPFPFHR